MTTEKDKLTKQVKKLAQVIKPVTQANNKQPKKQE